MTNLELFETEIFEENILPFHILDQFFKAEPNLSHSVLVAAKTKLALLKGNILTEKTEKSFTCLSRG